MKLMCVPILFLVLLGCTEQKAEVVFDCIDYSCYDGHSKSIKIFNNSRTFITFKYNQDEGNTYYSLTLTKESMDSISKMEGKLLNDKLDTIYHAFSADHPKSLSLIIKSKGRIILTSYNGDLVEEKFKSLFQLTRYLDKLIYKYRDNLTYKLTETSDSAIVFDSKSRLIFPSPPSPRPLDETHRKAMSSK